MYCPIKATANACVDCLQNISYHASRQADSGSPKNVSGTSNQLTVTRTRALDESLKLLFNLTRFYPERVDEFDAVVPKILFILDRISLPKPALQAPVTLLINALLNLSLQEQQLHGQPRSDLFPHASPARSTQRLITILESGLQSEHDADKLEISATPLLSVLRRIYEIAPPSVAEMMRDELLPTSEDRSRPLGRTDSLPSRLLRLSQAPSPTNLKEAVSGLLFELSDSDALTFIKNVGYGYAAGFLMTHRIAISASNGRDGDLPGVEIDGQEVNPITGQRRDMEPVDTGPEMTDEEKEREAERLFVLFERLKATGVVNVVNPIEQAQQASRFEDLD